MILLEKIEGKRNVGDKDKESVMRDKKIKDEENGGKYIKGRGIEIEIEILIIRKGFKEKEEERLRKIKGEKIKIKMRKEKF